MCRRASGEFDEGRRILDLSVEVPRLFSGDVDADGYDDLVTQASNGSELHFFDDGGDLSQTVGVPGVGVPLTLGQLTPGKQLDLAMVGEGLMVHRGQQDRTTLPTIYASYLLEVESRAYLAFDAMPEQYGGDGASAEVAFAGDEVLLLTQEGLVDPSRPADAATVVPLHFDASRALDDLPTGELGDRVGGSSPCEELVLAEHGGTSVDVVTPCAPTLDEGFYDYDAQAHDPGHFVRVQLPELHSLEAHFSVGSVNLIEPIEPRVFLVDVDDDGYLDIVATAVRDFGGGDEASRLCVAFNDQLGTFQSVSVAATGTAVHNQFHCAAIPFEWPPIAVGHLNSLHDGELDFVLPIGLAVSQRVYDTNSPDHYWVDSIEYHVTYYDSYFSSAVVRDLNANGFADVVAFEKGRNEFLFLNGDGRGAMAEFHRPLQGEPTQLLVGDFDGDLLGDVAALESRGPVESEDGGQSSQLADERWLSVAFGASFGPPGEPVELGKVGVVEDAVVADLKSLAYDANDDLFAVLSVSDSSGAGGQAGRAVAMLAGATDRWLLSPFYFSVGAPGGETIEHRPYGVVVGQFDEDPGHDDVAVFSLPPDEHAAADPTPMLWLLPAHDDAEIEASRVQGSPLDVVWVEMPDDESQPQEYLREGALMAAADLDGDGNDEVMVFASMRAVAETSTNEQDEQEVAAYAMPKGSIFVAKAEADQGTWRWREVQRLDTSAYYFASSGGGTGMYRIPTVLGMDDGTFELADRTLYPTPYDGHVAVADVDGDEDEDVVVLQAEVSWEGWFGSSPAAMATRIGIYLNQQELPLALDSPILLEAPGGQTPTGFCFLNADRDRALEMAVVTTEGLWVGDLVLDQKERVARLESAREIDSRGGLHVASGDFDADGVDDLVIVDAEQVRLLFGVPETTRVGGQG